MSDDDVLNAQRDGWEAVRAVVFARDMGCMTSRLDPDELSPCRGMPTLNHVKAQPMMARKAPDDEAHLVVVCYHHHLGGWATSKRAIARQRAYLASLYPAEWPAEST
jgi:hypothetical protein